MHKMFDGLLKSKFYSKCKSDLKMTRTRIELIRKKRNAMQKYLRKDVADLLRNGLDINAFGRAEGLIAEQNRSSCYVFIEQSCEHLSKHLSAMNKQRECPEECREAASSLMFAAARFADLPELRELRTIFSERYGNSLDCFLNKEFADKLKSGLPSKDVKLQLLQDIASESGLEWDSKALENMLFNESAYNKNLAKERDCNEHSLHNNKDNSVQKKGRAEYEFHYPREFDPNTKKDLSCHEQNETTRHEGRIPWKRENTSPPKDEKAPPLSERTEVPPVKDIQVDTIARTPEKPNKPPPVINVPKEDDEDNNNKPHKYISIPPPYTKSEANKHRSSLRDDASSKDKVETAVDDVKTKPVPKSARRRNLKPLETSEGDEKDKTSRERAAQGRRILKFFDCGDRPDEDDEEKRMDELLQHYSRKDSGKKAARSKSRDGPNRLSSLPAELATSPTETPKRHNRAASLQPEMLGNAHVHPKLPDYDDFVARLAAFRGRI